MNRIPGYPPAIAAIKSIDKKLTQPWSMIILFSIDTTSMAKLKRQALIKGIPVCHGARLK